MKIGLFDSGIGGLTVLKELLEKELASTIVYYADTNNSPYGEKSVEEVAKLSKKNIDFLFAKGVDIVIIACNTAAIALYQSNQQILADKRIIDIIKVVTDNLSKDLDTLGIIGTRLTISSHRHRELLEKRLKNTKIVEGQAPMLCSLIEKGWDEEDNVVLEEYLAFTKENNLENLLLACTHYPLLKTEIAKYYHGNLIDPASFVAKRIADLKEGATRGYKENTESIKNIEVNEGANKNIKTMYRAKVDFYINGDIAPFKEHLSNFVDFVFEKNFYQIEKKI